MRVSTVRWSRFFVVSALGAVLVAACGDGGGGGKTVDCAKVPTAPVCRPDVSGDAFVPGDATGSCSVGARRCTGTTPEVCQNGQWVPLAPCAADATCTNGSCIDNGNDCCAGMECGTDCGASCGTCGQNEKCSDGLCVPDTVCQPQCAAKECGPNGCGGSCGTCNPNEGCQAGQCVPNVTCSCNGAVCGEDNCGNSCGTCAVGADCVAGRCEGGNVDTGDSCTDIVDCIYNDTDGCVGLPDDQVDACAEACVLDGTTTAQAEFEAYLACAAGCEDDTCFVMSCSDEQAACFFDKHGSGTCTGILDCFDTCSDTDDACYQGCWEGATAEAQAALLGYSNCLDLECPDAPAGDPCYNEAAAGACKDFVDACLAN